MEQVSLSADRSKDLLVPRRQPPQSLQQGRGTTLSTEILSLSVACCWKLKGDRVFMWDLDKTSQEPPDEFELNVPSDRDKQRKRRGVDLFQNGCQGLLTLKQMVKSVVFTDVELKFGVSVGEADPQVTFRRE